MGFQDAQQPPEASSQSELIKNRIYRHQSSSPTLIIEAIKHLPKGARSFMHQIALLRPENQMLREENALLVGVAGPKKTYLSEGGVLTVGKGQGIQGQNDVDAQIQEETQRRSGQMTRTETKPRRCGVCRNSGHNSCTCPTEVEMSQEDNSD